MVATILHFCLNSIISKFSGLQEILGFSQIYSMHKYFNAGIFLQGDFKPIFTLQLIINWKAFMSKCVKNSHTKCLFYIQLKFASGV